MKFMKCILLTALALLLFATLGAADPLPASKENPLVIDREARTVHVYAEVNGKYLYEPTRHGLVGGGSNCKKAVFMAHADALAFHDALQSLGAVAGNNVKKDSPAGTVVAGQPLEVTVRTAEGRSYPLAQVIKSSPEGGLEPRFGGNREFQGEMKTGCLLCLDSCAAGITSNAAWGTKSFDGKKVSFTGNPEILKDGEPVVLSFASR